MRNVLFVPLSSFRLHTNIKNSIERGTECCQFSSDNSQWKICFSLHTISEVRLSTNQNASFQPFAKSCVLLNFVTQGWFVARSFGGKVVREIRRYNHWRQLISFLTLCIHGGPWCCRSFWYTYSWHVAWGFEQLSLLNLFSYMFLSKKFRTDV